MKFSVCILAAMLCVSLSTSIVAARELPIVFEEYPPYEYMEKGEARGVNINLIREACKRMGYTPSFETLPWKRALFELEHGDILALASGFKTPKRETYAIYPSESLAMETNVIIALSVSGVEVKSLEDLRGLTIGVIRGYAYGHEFDSMIGLTKIEANSNLQLLRMLLNQRMDVIVGNRVGMKYLARETGKLSSIKFIHEVGSEPLYLFFSRARGKEAEALSHDFGQAIRSMREDGTFKSIVDNY